MSLKDQLHNSAKNCKLIEQELKTMNEINQDLKDQLCTEKMEKCSILKQLNLVRSEREDSKRELLLVSMNAVAAISGNYTELAKRQKIMEKVESKLEKTEVNLSKMFPAPITYSAVSTNYRQMCSVRSVIDYMKVAAPNQSDLEDLGRKVMKNLSPSNPSFFSLSPKNTFLLRNKLHLTDGNLKEMKRFLKSVLDVDFLASRGDVDKFRKNLRIPEKYDFYTDIIEKEAGNGRKTMIPSARVIIRDIQEYLSARLTDLDRTNKLVFDENTGGDIVVTLCGDKGSDETKLCLSLQNVSYGNSPDNLILLGYYEGADNDKELKLKANRVFDQWNQMTTVTYTAKNGSLITRLLRKQVCGDLKFLSCLLGHQGQSSSSPCHICTMSWSQHGSGMRKLEDCDFSQCISYRTLRSIEKDAENGDNSIKKHSTPLCLVEPIEFLIPTVHIIMGIYTTYFEAYILGEANRMDLKNLKNSNISTNDSKSSLRDQKKHLRKISKIEKEIELQVATLSSSLDDAYAVSAALMTLIENPKKHLKQPMKLQGAAELPAQALSAISKK
ncbi:hypothetical protein CRE_22153 [Caenorhabditis remanei]|uniref:Uncharacterized protein n=1 Tax=Caenorhabditis remanei TaxID=31234 RepID=E3NJ04_CAERE|nr:hypothetical protein CRE_22153 [Caenorhabditis remanei]